MPRSVALLLLLLAVPPFFAGGAFADDLMVLSPAIAVPVLRQLAAGWSQTSGMGVKFRMGNVGETVGRVGAVPADIIVLPPDAMAAVMAKVKPASLTRLPSAQFGLAGKKGTPHPDISTVEKFAAYLKASSGIQFNVPEEGSASGAAIAEMLKRPEFKGVIARPIHEMPGPAVAKGDAELGGGAISEEIYSDGAEVIGMFPAGLDMRLDFSGAVLSDAAQADKAASFLAYVTGPAAKAVWQANGFR